jgi:hypothetical protein
MTVGLMSASKFSALTAKLSSGLEFVVALGEDDGLAAGELVAGRDVADGAVEPAGDVCVSFYLPSETT